MVHPIFYAHRVRSLSRVGMAPTFSNKYSEIWEIRLKYCPALHFKKCFLLKCCYYYYYYFVLLFSYIHFILHILWVFFFFPYSRCCFMIFSSSRFRSIALGRRFSMAVHDIRGNDGINRTLWRFQTRNRSRTTKRGRWGIYFA